MPFDIAAQCADKATTAPDRRAKHPFNLPAATLWRAGLIHRGLARPAALRIRCRTLGPLACARVKGWTPRQRELLAAFPSARKGSDLTPVPWTIELTLCPPRRAYKGASFMCAAIAHDGSLPNLRKWKDHKFFHHSPDGAIYAGYNDDCWAAKGLIDANPQPVGRPRKSGARTPSGILSEATRAQFVRFVSDYPTPMRRLKDGIKLGMRGADLVEWVKLPFSETVIGRLMLLGRVTEEQHQAGMAFVRDAEQLVTHTRFHQRGYPAQASGAAFACDCEHDGRPMAGGYADSGRYVQPQLDFDPEDDNEAGTAGVEPDDIAAETALPDENPDIDPVPEARGTQWFVRWFYGEAGGNWDGSDPYPDSLRRGTAAAESARLRMAWVWQTATADHQRRIKTVLLGRTLHGPRKAPAERDAPGAGPNIVGGTDALSTAIRCAADRWTMHDRITGKLGKVDLKVRRRWEDLMRQWEAGGRNGNVITADEMASPLNEWGTIIQPTDRHVDPGKARPVKLLFEPALPQPNATGAQQYRGELHDLLHPGTGRGDGQRVAPDRPI
jgi:hypothetical protein